MKLVVVGIYNEINFAKVWITPTDMITTYQLPKDRPPSFIAYYLEESYQAMFSRIHILIEKIHASGYQCIKSISDVPAPPGLRHTFIFKANSILPLI